MTQGDRNLSLPPSVPAPAWTGPASGFEHPASAQIAIFLQNLGKTIKGIRLYAENSEMLHKFLDDSHNQLSQILTELPEFSLTIHEDRLTHERDEVLVDTDREEGIPYVFYRNAFRRLTFMQGFTREELFALLSEFGREVHERDPDQDLVSGLWKVALPNFHYVTIDSLNSASATASDADERDDVERIQDDLEHILASIYSNVEPDEDIVRSVSIDKLDLEALKQAEVETNDLDVLDAFTARAIMGLDGAALDRAKTEASTPPDSLGLVYQLSCILIFGLLRARDDQEALEIASRVESLVDTLMVGQRLAEVAAIARQLQSEPAQQTSGARFLMSRLVTEARIGSLLSAVNEEGQRASIAGLVDVLRSLGPNVSPVLLAALDDVEEPGRRRIMVEIIGELGVPDVAHLTHRIQNSRWFVARDILTIASALPSEELAAVVLPALQNEHPKVRAAAVALLRNFRPGTADRLLAGALEDQDLDVRLAAIRVAAARQSSQAKPVFLAMLRAPEFQSRDPKEIRLITMAYARLAGESAVPELEALLNQGFFSSIKSMDAQLAAAVALGSLNADAARAVLKKGRRSLNKHIREACKRALESHEGRGPMYS